MERKWKNTRRDPLPNDQAQVFIAVRGIYYSAVFDASREEFITTFDSRNKVFPAYMAEVYWTESE